MISLLGMYVVCMYQCGGTSNNWRIIFSQRPGPGAVKPGLPIDGSTGTDGVDGETLVFASAIIYKSDMSILAWAETWFMVGELNLRRYHRY